jgi:hypothetical protein
MNNNEKIIKLIDELNDILSSGQGEGIPSNYHKKEVPKMFIKYEVTDQEKQDLFAAYYNPPPDDCTMEEIEWMMELCGVKSFTYTLSNDEDEE